MLTLSTAQASDILTGAATRAVRPDSRTRAWGSFRDQFRRTGAGSLEKPCCIRSDSWCNLTWGDTQPARWHVAAPVTASEILGYGRSEDCSLRLYRLSRRDSHGAELRSSRSRRAPEGSGTRRLRTLAGGVRRQRHVGAGPALARARG